MKNLKRLMCAIAAVAMLLVQSHTAQAKFNGSLRGDQPLLVYLAGFNANVDSTALTITFIDSRGRSDVEVATIAAHDELHFLARSGPIPKGTVRVIVEVDNPVGGACRVRMEQGNDPSGNPIQVVAEDVFNDLRFVFDVV